MLVLGLVLSMHNHYSVEYGGSTLVQSTLEAIETAAVNGGKPDGWGDTESKMNTSIELGVIDAYSTEIDGLIVEYRK